jgi:(4S)-4-hydroxy-5-phosphonooxypentane-2,3-dione isomerase
MSLHGGKFFRQPSKSQPVLELWGDLAYHSDMFIVHVHIRVKPECIEAFKAATLANARASVQEPGVARFDVVQQADDPTRFVLVEVYRDADANAAHKLTEHYAVWRDTVAAMMAEPRSSVKFNNVFPDDEGW